MFKMFIIKRNDNSIRKDGLVGVVELSYGLSGLEETFSFRQIEINNNTHTQTKKPLCFSKTSFKIVNQTIEFLNQKFNLILKKTFYVKHVT